MRLRRLFLSRHFYCNGKSAGVNSFNDASVLIICPSKHKQKSSLSKNTFCCT